MIRLPKLKTSAAKLCFITATYVSLCLNLSFTGKVLDIAGTQTEMSALFLLSVPAVLIALLNIAFLPFSSRYSIKPALIFIVVTSAMFNYGAFHYGVIFDDNMFRNFAETDTTESAAYLSFSLLATLLLTGVLPAYLIAKTDITKNSFKKEALMRMASVGISVFLVGFVAFFYFQDYVSIGRNNTVLRKSVIPLYPYKMAYKFIRKDYFQKPVVFRQLALDATHTPPETARKKLVVLILGETQRSMNYSLYGYTRKTNTFTENLGLTVFQDVTSYGTATAQSVPYIFSMTPENYDADDEKNQDNIIDVANRTGIALRWLDNNGGCKGVCDRVDFEDMRKVYADRAEFCRGNDGCYDSLFIEDLQKQIDTLPDQDALIVMHIMGSHGPSYWQRYPETHRKFTPDCPKNDIQHCTTEELVNTYDNTIYYADDVMAQTIALLQKTSDSRDTSMLFLSDHGESLGEKGLYLHGMPRALAPIEQRSVPMMLWLSDGFAAQQNINRDCLLKTAAPMPIDNANLSDSLMGLLDIKSSLYTKEADYIAPCRIGKTQDSPSLVQHP